MVPLRLKSASFWMAHKYEIMILGKREQSQWFCRQTHLHKKDWYLIFIWNIILIM